MMGAFLATATGMRHHEDSWHVNYDELLYAQGYVAAKDARDVDS